MDKLQDKVKLPEAVAAQLDWINQHHDYPVRVVVDVFNGQVHGDLPVLAEFFESDRSRRITLITQALVNGYEVEQTPEDKVRKIFDSVNGKINGDPFKDGYHRGIVQTLSALNIKIKGVNDHE